MSAVIAKKGDTTGLTLIELLAVLLIAGLLAAMSVPTFKAIIKGAALKTAAKALTDTFSLARQFAITNRYQYCVELVYKENQLPDAERLDDIDDSLQIHRYRVYYVDREAMHPANPRDTEKITVRKWRSLPQLVQFDDRKPPPRAIVFNPTGGAFELPSGSWWPRNFLIVQPHTGPNEKAMTIKLDGFTGRAKAEAGDTT